MDGGVHRRVQLHEGRSWRSGAGEDRQGNEIELVEVTQLLQDVPDLRTPMPPKTTEPGWSELQALSDQMLKSPTAAAQAVIADKIDAWCNGHTPTQ